MKYIKLILLSIVAMVFMAACGNSSEVSKEDDDSDFPNKPIKLIVPFGAGGGTDIGARVLAGFVEDELGVSVTIENKAGASGWVGLTELLNSEPDGYTLGYINTPTVVTGYLNPETEREHTIESFTTIANQVSDPGVMAINPKEDRFTTAEELIEYAKDNEVTATTTGLGSDDHFAFLKLNDALGTKFKAIHKDGLPEMKTDVLGGHVDVLFANVGDLAPDHKNGEIKVLAILEDKRSEYLPDVPTFEELGYGDIYSGATRGIGAPGDLEPDIKRILEEAFKNAIENPEHIKEMEKMNLTVDYLNGDDYIEMLREEESFIKGMVDLLGW